MQHHPQTGLDILLQHLQSAELQQATLLKLNLKVVHCRRKTSQDVNLKFCTIKEKTDKIMKWGNSTY